VLTDQTHRELSRIGRNYVFESGTRLASGRGGKLGSRSPVCWHCGRLFLQCQRGVTPEKRTTVDRTDQISDGGLRSNVLGSSQRPLGSRLSQEASSKEKPRLCRTRVGAILFGVTPEYRHAVRGLNWLKPASCSKGRITDLICLLTLELSFEAQYTSNLVETVQGSLPSYGSCLARSKITVVPSPPGPAL
jgi:hypothetical protein